MCLYFNFGNLVFCVSELYWVSWKDSTVDILLKFDIFQNRETTLGNLGLKGYESVASMLLQYINCSSIVKIWLQVVVSLLLRQTMRVMYLQVSFFNTLLPLPNRPLEIHNQKYLFARYLVCLHYLGCVSGYVLGQFSFRCNWNDSLLHDPYKCSWKHLSSELHHGLHSHIYFVCFFVCLFVCGKCEVHGVQKGSCDLWRNIVQSDKCSTKSCPLNIYVSQQAMLSFTCKGHCKLFHVFW